ncbi:hypothetical protein AQUCO_01300314v1 [Aquilegia coerulea]|uniref:NAC domain-containing protein n=1 Tax=Aquilegia coerulea TaxID=218851 RepID=A0A2G5E0X0_AQUCA|nr:hypothetical protein AQUCO_01300314v1 [Aquilegia coerulea]
MCMDIVREQEEEAVLVVPPGFQFCPTDHELLSYYLTKKLRGDEDLPKGVIVDRTLYGKEAPEPWKIFEGRTKVDEVIYFYTWVNKKHSGSNSNYYDRFCGEGKWKIDKTYEIFDSQNRLLGFKKKFNFDADKNKYGSWIMEEFTLNTPNPNNKQELAVCMMHRGRIIKKSEDKYDNDQFMNNMPCSKKRTRIVNESEPPRSTKMLKQTMESVPAASTPQPPLIIDEQPMLAPYGGLIFPTFEGTAVELTFGMDLTQQDHHGNCLWMSHQESQPQPPTQPCIIDSYDSLLQQEWAPTSWPPAILKNNYDFVPTSTPVVQGRATVQTSVSSPDNNYSCMSATLERERTTSPTKFNMGGTTINSPIQTDDNHHHQPDQGVPAAHPQPDANQRYGVQTQSYDQPQPDNVPAARSQPDVDQCAYGVEDLSYLDTPEFWSECTDFVGDNVDAVQEEDDLYKFFGNFPDI